MMKNFFLPLILLCGFYGMAQAELNKYKYIIVPVKFEAFKHENQYQTSTLIKYNLVENGFTAVYDSDMPEDLLANRCLGLLLNLKDDSSMFTTKVTLTLKDCQSKEIYTTVEGSSKEKDFKSAYSEAIKECFKSLSGIGYKFEPTGNNAAPAVSFKNDVKRIEGRSNVEPKQSTPNPVVQQTATLEEQSYKNREPVQSNITKAEISPAKALPKVDYKTDGVGVLYAQAIATGFQLVDSTPKITLKIYATSQANFYIAEGEVHNGVVLKKGEKWYFEYYEGDKLMGQELNIKF
ncbi:hypothetical protein QSE00_17695 [Arenibacter sp. M-2]|uniref:hypothetical protein n=1 Tax=Arenibacter sp. M-2 TaxID=3053612 RepID=UPI00256FFB1F|nr:hypothetical protein [Arenibacter sp. M-2]MDL5513659.1 hypothetical protein [Arenibacter sp. M-2]